MSEELAGSAAGNATGSASGRVGLPRKKREDFTWRSVYFPVSWLSIIIDMAQREDRSLSSMLRQLVRDGLVHRGVEVPEPPGEYNDEGR